MTMPNRTLCSRCERHITTRWSGQCWRCEREWWWIVVVALLFLVTWYGLSA